jgi:hypothetical protein
MRLWRKTKTLSLKWLLYRKACKRQTTDCHVKRFVTWLSTWKYCWCCLTTPIFVHFVKYLFISYVQYILSKKFSLCPLQCRVPKGKHQKASSNHELAVSTRRLKLISLIQGS